MGPRPATLRFLGEPGGDRCPTVTCLRSVRAEESPWGGIMLEGRVECACTPCPCVVVSTSDVENAIALVGLQRAFASCPGDGKGAVAPHPCLARCGVLFDVVSSYLSF